MSKILFCFLVNNGFDILKKSKSGFYVGRFFAGVLGYADDPLLLSPSREGLQQMVSIVESYAAEHNIPFSTHPIASKSKRTVFSEKELNWTPEPVLLCRNKLPRMQNTWKILLQTYSIECERIHG